MTDILDRDQDNFVKIRKTNRLGWESLIPEGGNYSDILLGVTRVGDLVKEAYTMARDYIVAMDTPYKVLLRLSPEMNCTDSKVVYLSTKVFDDSALTDAQKMDTFIGLAIHEGCHLKWTDFKQMGESDSAVVRNLINILEDERIERECGEHMPGYANFLKATKYYMFDLYCQRLEKDSQKKELSEGTRLLNAILSMIRYPKVLNRDDVEQFADALYDVRKVIENYPKTRDEVSAAANAIYEIIKKYFEKKAEEDSGDDKEQESKDSDGSKSQNSQSESSENSGEDGNDSGSASNDGGDSSQDIQKRVEEAMSELESQAECMDELSTEPGGGEAMDRDQMADCVKRNNGQLAGICENMVELGQTSKTVLYKAEENASAYDSSLSRVRKYVPAIAKTLKGYCSEYQVTYRGMRSGALDTGKLAEAFQGVQTVYVREGKVKSDKMAVCVLIDESGSMYGEKINAARDLAVLLNEAISSVPAIDLYVYGHTYGDRCRDSYRAGEQICELQLYREKGFCPRKAIGSVSARSGNLDSLAIREAAVRMKKFSACGTNMMFVITDGAPNEKYEQLAQTVKQLEKQGVSIVAVCIESEYDPSMLYTHHVRFTDMSSLALDLGKMIKKSILKNANRHNE